jgi:hypothetical protein
MRTANISGIVLVASLLLIQPPASLEPPTTLELTIPDYTITSVGDLDYVEIPGGELLSEEEGRPQVPYYTTSMDYPPGYSIQDVRLVERSGLTTEDGLKLPVVVLSEFPEMPMEMIAGWYPEKEFDWKVWSNEDGSSKLMLVVYPFYYRPETTEINFYKQYSFEIEYVYSEISITALFASLGDGDAGKVASLEVWIHNPTQAQDVIVSPVIKQYGSNEVVQGLSLRSLKDLVGEASYKTEWDSAGLDLASCYVEVSLLDDHGKVLARRISGFSPAASEAEEVTAEEAFPTEQEPAAPPATLLIVLVIIGALIGVAMIIAGIILAWKRR